MAFWLALVLLSVTSQTATAASDLDRSTPRAAVVGYLEACREADYERAATFLNLSPVREADRAQRGPVLARQLKEVLDQKLWVDVEGLSSEPEGDLGDDLPPSRDLIGAIETEKGPLDVFVDRVHDTGGLPVWKISAVTVAAIPDLAEQFGTHPLLARLPAPLVQLRLLEIALWQWLALLVLLAGAWLAAWGVATLTVALVRPLAARSSTDFDDRLLALIVSPLRLLAAVGLFALGSLGLGLTLPAREFFRSAELALLVVGFTWLFFRLIDLVARTMEEHLDAESRSGAGHFVPIGARTLKAAVGVMSLLAALDSFGLDITALIAGLGVGGLAVALAAQKTLENVFGGVTILADQPVRPGEFCRFGDQIGTVEEIGLRSTRVRTLARTVITVPNSEFSTLQIENFAARDRIMLTVKLGLRYETTPGQLRHVLVGLREVLYGHPRIDRSPTRVRFVGFGDYSLDLEVYCYVDTTDWNEFLAIREDVFLRIMDVVAASGTGFAFPSQTAYLAQDAGVDAGRAAAAEAQVAEWRRQGELMLPDHPDGRIGELRGKLDWPPAGSPQAADAAARSEP
jgi:MscS family membrane protein